MRLASSKMMRAWSRLWRRRRSRRRARLSHTSRSMPTPASLVDLAVFPRHLFVDRSGSGACHRRASSRTSSRPRTSATATARQACAPTRPSSGAGSADRRRCGAARRSGRQTRPRAWPVPQIAEVALARQPDVAAGDDLAGHDRAGIGGRLIEAPGGRLITGPLRLVASHLQLRGSVLSCSTAAVLRNTTSC